MIEAILNRRYYKQCTLGTLLVSNLFSCVTLELPWNNNQNNISCIPEGGYLCKFLEYSPSKKYRNVYHVTGTGNRLGILIHPGNYARDTHGCILLGQYTHNFTIINSQATLRKFNESLNKEDFFLTIMKG